MTTSPSINIQPFTSILHPSESHCTQRKFHRGPIAQPQPIHPLAHADLLDEADADRFAPLFMPATPPATPTPIFRDQHPATTHSQPHHRNRTVSAESDPEFGAFVSVPPAQDPLSFDPPVAEHLLSSNTSLDYFDQFTSNAKTSSDQSRRTVLNELLEHEDDPLYFVHRQSPTSPMGENLLASPLATFVESPLPSVPQSDTSIDTDIESSPPPKPPVYTPSIPSQFSVRTPLPPRLSGTASPPSIHSPPASSSSLPLPSSTPPAHAALSRLSSSWVSSLLPSARLRHSTVPPSSTSTIVHSAPGTTSQLTSPPHIHVARPSPGVTRGTPFAYHPYIPPSGAPGFGGDRTWDKGFSDSLEDEEMREVKGVLGKTNKGKGKQGRGVNLTGRRDGTQGVLNVNIANLIRPHLPALTRLPRTWTLLYSLDQHGISLNTLYSRCEPKLPSAPGATKGALVVVRDARDAVFGIWLGEGLWLERGLGYYGSGESFLWRYHCHGLLSKDAEDGLAEDIDVYKWTGKNDYVAHCEPEFISFGGGDGHYGLYLDGSLLDGSSAPCPTFDNPVLCSYVDGGGLGSKKDVSFECVGLEVWGIGP